LRMAATVVTHDPIFDWIAYGGTLRKNAETLAVIPRDGLSQRLTVVLPEKRLPGASAVRLKIELERDGFMPEQAIVLDKQLQCISFALENRTKDRHITRLRLGGLPSMTYSIVCNGQKVPLSKTSSWDYPWQAELPMNERPAQIEIRR